MIEFTLADNRHEYWYDASDCAKFLEIKDTTTKRILGRNKFLQYCRFNKIIMIDSNQPKQQMIQLGLMRYHTVTKHWKTYGICLWSERGLNYVKARIADGRYQIGYVKRKDKHTRTLDEVC